MKSFLGCAVQAETYRPFYVCCMKTGACFHESISDATSGWAEWASAQPEFGSSANPITTRGTDWALHITASPPGFENPAASLSMHQKTAWLTAHPVYFGQTEGQGIGLEKKPHDFWTKFWGSGRSAAVLAAPIRLQLSNVLNVIDMKFDFLQCYLVVLTVHTYYLSC